MDGGWIEWSGGAMPVAHDCWVEVCFRDADQRVGLRARPARDWIWRHEQRVEDIVAYRVAPHQPADRA